MSQITSFAAAGGVGSVITLTGNSGGAVSPNGSGNINILGGSGVAVAGNPGTNTLTISVSAGAFSYTNVNSAASPYTVLTSDYYLSVDCSAGPITLKFPNSALLGQSFIVKDRTGNAQANNITLTSVSGSVNVDGAATFVLNVNYQSCELVGNNTSYEIF